MFNLGLRLTLKSGREALVRLMLTAVAVAIGVMVLLSILADYHAFQIASDRPSWESTPGQPISGSLSNKPGTELWNYSENIFKGQFIEQLDVAQLGANAPVIPGLSKLPGAGQLYTSPALAVLLRTVPSDELGNRFPGKQIGTIGQKGLSFPTELAVVVGYTPSQLQKLPGTVEVSNIATGAQLQGTTNLYRLAFKIGAIAILFPLLILINTSTRLATTRREERYAAMRLIGATRQQINKIASIDAGISALFGSVLGIVIFLLIRPILADLSFSGVKFFSNTVTPTVWGYLLMLIGVPIAATISSLISLYRVQISPLGVSRRTSSPPPGAWRIIPLLLGVPIFIGAALRLSDNINSSGPGPLFVLGFLLILVGVVVSGPWLTMWLSKGLGKYASSASTLLASRRLADNPKVAFRSVSGLVLAVFVGSVIATIAPTINAAQSPISSASLNNILRISYNFGPLPASVPPGAGGDLKIKITPGSNQAPPIIGLPINEATALINKLQSFSGTSVLPIYDNTNYQNVMTCASLRQLPVLGRCAPGLKYVGAGDVSSLLFTDNPLFVNKALPIVSIASQGTTGNLNGLYMQGLLIKTDNQDTLEKVRTYLTNYDQTLQLSAGGEGLSGWQMGDLEPETFGEVAKIRNNDDSNIERVVLAAVMLTIVIAGCSLAVTVGGSLVERKRPFTLLRLSGTPLSVLYKVIFLEAALPLVVASVAAAAIGISVTTPVIQALLKNLAPSAKYAAHPGALYYLMIGIGLVVSLILVTITLPILKLITKPEDFRFE